MKIRGSIIVAASLVLAFFIFGLFYYSAQKEKDSIFVIGTASEQKTSDLVKWTININKSTGFDNRNQVAKELIAQTNALVQVLQKKGVDPKEISMSKLSFEDRWESNAQVGYRAVLAIKITSEKVNEIEKLSSNTDLLLDNLSNCSFYSNTEYYIKDLNPIKHKLLEAATLDAKTRAKALAKNSGRGVGKINSIKTGVFQVTEPFSTDVSDYGIYDTQTKEKMVTITVNAYFDLV